MKNKSRITKRGQITIPVCIRRKLGIFPGMSLILREEEGRIVVEKDVEDDSVDWWYGSVKLNDGKTTDDYINEMRLMQ